MYPRTIAFLKSINKGKKIKLRLRCEGRMKSATFFLDYTSLGDRQKNTLGYSISEDPKNPHNDEIIQKAVLSRDKKEIELAERGDEFVLAKEREATRDDLYETMKQWIERTYYVEGTKQSHLESLAKFKEFMGKRKQSIHRITKNDLRDFKKYLLGTMHQNYARHTLGRVAVFFNKMEEDGVIVASPARKVSIPALPPSSIVYIDDDEIRKIALVQHKQIVEWASNAPKGDFKDPKARGHITHCKVSEFEEIKQAFIFQCFSGLRISDVRGLNVSSFEKDGKSIAIVMKKTKSRLAIPIHVTAYRIIAKRLLDAKEIGPYAPIFNLPRSTDFSRILKAIGAVAGISVRMESRLARRSFATALVRHNIAILDTSKMLGHSSTRMTERYYAGVSVERLQGELEKLPRIIEIEDEPILLEAKVLKPLAIEDQTGHGTLFGCPIEEVCMGC